MNWRWLLYDYCDPELKLTPAQRKRIRKRAMQSPRGKKLKRILALAYISVILIFPPWLFLIASLIEDLNTYLVGALTLLPVILIPIVGGVALAKIMPEAINESLKAFGFEKCQNCDHQLRGLDEYQIKCPECGEERTAIICFRCGHSLKGITQDVPICPECGTNQRILSKPKAMLWFGQLPDQYRSRVLRDVINTNLAIFMVIGILVTTSYLLLWNSNYISFPLWPLFLVYILLIYGIRVRSLRNVRQAMHDRGTDICLKCGSFLHQYNSDIKDCPQCGYQRKQMDASVDNSPIMPNEDELQKLSGMVEEHKLTAVNVAFSSVHVAIRWFLGVTSFCLCIGLLRMFYITNGLTDFYGVATIEIVALGTVTAIWILEAIILTPYLVRSYYTELRRLVRTQARQEGHEVCLGCGSWLRGMEDEITHCPACGAVREEISREQHQAKTV